MRGICVASGCENSVDYRSVEVLGAGFVCSDRCEAAAVDELYEANEIAKSERDENEAVARYKWGR